VGVRHAVPERASCTCTPSKHRAHPAWRLCFSSSTGNPACASVPTRRTPQFLAILPTSFPVLAFAGSLDFVADAFRRAKDGHPTHPKQPSVRNFEARRNGILAW